MVAEGISLLNESFLLEIGLLIAVIKVKIFLLFDKSFIINRKGKKGKNGAEHKNQLSAPLCNDK